jgi:hypothetical protein
LHHALNIALFYMSCKAIDCFYSMTQYLCSTLLLNCDQHGSCM